MTERRSQKLARLVRVQRQIERLAENDLGLILRERASVEESRRSLVAALGSLEPVHRSMAGHYARRYAGTEVSVRKLIGLQAVQEKRVLVERTKADRLADNAREAAAAEDREAQDETLLDLLDAALAGRTDSSPA